jgi:hypothetical protein
LERSFGLLRPTSPGELVVAHNLAIVAVDNSRQIRQTVGTAGVGSVAGRSLLRAA